VDGVTDFSWLLMIFYYLPPIISCSAGGVWLGVKIRYWCIHTDQLMQDIMLTKCLYSQPISMFTCCCCCFRHYLYKKWHPEQEDKPEEMPPPQETHGVTEVYLDIQESTGDIVLSSRSTETNTTVNN